MRASLLAIVLLCLVTPALAQSSTGFYKQGPVEYYMAVGGLGSGHLSRGHDYDADDQVDFYGCLVAKVRPDKELGRVRVVSQIGTTPVEIEILEFDAPRKDMQGGIAVGLPVDGSRTHGTIEHPAVDTDVAAWGEAVIDIEGYIYQDPTNDNLGYAATWFVTPEGFRNDETGQVLNHDGTIYEPGRRAIRNAGEYEMHLRLESMPGSASSGTTFSEQVPDPILFGGGLLGTPAEYLQPTPDYRQVYTFLNTRYGGNGTLDVAASAMQAIGTDNHLDFIMRAPSGEVVSELTLTPEAGQQDTDSGTFILDGFGYYSLEVAGDVNWLEYSFDFHQSPPEVFDLHFWWDNVTLGGAAPEAQKECYDTLNGASAESQGSILPREAPPRWPMPAVVVTVLAFFCTAMVAVTMVVLRRAEQARKRMLG